VGPGIPRRRSPTRKRASTRVIDSFGTASIVVFASPGVNSYRVLIHPGVVIPPGDYRWTRYRFEVNTATKRPWVADFAWWWGSFYTGSLRQLELGLTWKPDAHLRL